MRRSIQEVSLPALRRAVADYMASEGCGCCSNHIQHKEDEHALAKLLDVPAFKDGSGYDFRLFATPRERRRS